MGAHFPHDTRSVYTRPGLSVCTPTGRPLVSSASDLVSCSMPALLMPYAAYFCVEAPSDPAPCPANHANPRPSSVHGATAPAAEPGFR